MDKYLVTVAVLLLFLECGWLLDDLNVIVVPGLHHAHASNAGPILGEITQRKKEVKRKTSSSLVWEETYDEQNLYAFDSILTLDQSTATVSLGKQSLITLQENTLVTIEPSDPRAPEGPVRLHFKKGAMRTTLAGGDQAIDVGDWVVEANDKTQLSIRSVGNAKFEIENHEGTVKVLNQKTSGAAKIIKAGQTLSISADSVSDVQEALDIKWEEPRDGARIYTHALSAEVPLKWQGQASDALVTEAQLNKVEAVPLVAGTGGQQSLPLFKGNYTVRLRNIYRDGDRATFARNIAVWEAPKIHLISPLTRQRIKLGTSVELRWTLNGDVKNYQWQVSLDPEFKSVMRSGKTSDNKANLADMPLGEFYWRVTGQDDKGFEIPEMYFNSFNVVVNPLEAPKLKKPSLLPDESFNFWNWIMPEAEADELPENQKPSKHYRAIFEWEPVAGAASYSIEICETPDFRNPLVKATTKHPQFKWRDFKLGQYYWRVAAQADTGELGLFSETAFADLQKVPVKPIIAISVEVARALELAKVNAAKPMPAPVPVVATPAPTPPSEPKPLTNDWEVSARAGGHAIASLFQGSGFQATQVGASLGDYRLLITPPRNLTRWRFEGEFQTENLKISNSSNDPFQNSIEAQTFRVTAIRENSDQGQASFGFSVHDQNYIFQRVDLQILSLQTPVSAGPFLDWRWLKENHESEYRLGAYFGTANSLEARALRTRYVSLSRPLDLTLTLDSKLTAGVTTGGSFWTDATVYIFLGVRWK